MSASSNSHCLFTESKSMDTDELSLLMLRNNSSCIGASKQEQQQPYQEKR
jgi:hypothetical protein